jgi:hypothetical protein
LWYFSLFSGEANYGFVGKQKPYHEYFKENWKSGFKDHWRGRRQCCPGIQLWYGGTPGQKSQNKDSLAIQLKLNELVAAHGSASNRLVNVEGMTEEELKVIQKYYTKLSDFAKKRDTLTESHSIDELHREHEIRKDMERELKRLE